MRLGRKFWFELDREKKEDELTVKEVMKKFGVNAAPTVVGWAKDVNARRYKGQYLFKNDAKLEARAKKWKATSLKRAKTKTEKGNEPENEFFDPTDKKSYRSDASWWFKFNAGSGHSDASEEKYEDAFGSIA